MEFPWFRFLILQIGLFTGSRVYSWWTNEKVTLFNNLMLAVGLAIWLYLKYITAPSEQRGFEELSQLFGLHAVQGFLAISVFVAGFRFVLDILGA